MQPGGPERQGHRASCTEQLGCRVRHTAQQGYRASLTLWLEHRASLIMQLGCMACLAAQQGHRYKQLGYEVSLTTNWGCSGDDITELRGPTMQAQQQGGVG